MQDFYSAQPLLHIFREDCFNIEASCKKKKLHRKKSINEEALVSIQHLLSANKGKINFSHMERGKKDYSA